jgi:phospholipid transport system substrate-binding protein
MRRRHCLAVLALAGAFASAVVRAEAVAADVFVKQLSDDVLDAVKADKAIQGGDVARIRGLVDTKVMPYVNFPRMVASTVGPQWRSATPEQKTRLQEEVKTLLVNTYSGALTQVKDQTIVVKPLRGGGDAATLIVRSDVHSRGEPVQLDYRLEKSGDSWKIYDVNVGGFWIVEAYRGQFATDLSKGGIDALIAALTEKNKGLAASAPKK